MQDQLALFGSKPAIPEGIRYEPDIISAPEEQQLIEEISRLPFEEYDFPGFKGKRRVVSFGWKYDFSASVLRKSDDMPEFLMPLREKAAAFADLAPDKLQHALVT